MAVRGFVSGSATDHAGVHMQARRENRIRCGPGAWEEGVFTKQDAEGDPLYGPGAERVWGDAGPLPG